MRTTVIDCLALAFLLIRHRRLRRFLRIGQILYSAADRSGSDIFYIENDMLEIRLDEYGRDAF